MANQTSSVIASYRLPKRAPERWSVVLLLFQEGDTYSMTGGPNGMHTITTTDRSRVRAHWAGYCSNGRGRAVKPGTIRFVEGVA